MPTIRQLTDPSANYLLPVLPVGPNVCDTCRTSITDDFDSCYQCNLARRRLPALADAVAPLALSVKGGQYAHELSAYKNSHSFSARRQLQNRLSALMWRWSVDHETCLAGEAGVDAFDIVTVVPSTSGRVDPPLRNMVANVVAPFVDRFADLLRYNPEAPADRSADAAKFIAYGVPRGADVLLVDDTWTQGGHAQSAACALKEAGAERVGIFVLGRHFTPRQQGEYGEVARWYLEESMRIGWSFDSCASE